MLPALLPLFPLPRVVLFPGTFLPLHVFEPRYQAMTLELLNGHRHLVIAQMRETPEAGDLGLQAPVFPVGCMAELVRAEPLPGGRWNVLLQGKAAVQLHAEVPGKPYRQVRTSPLPFEADRLWPGPHRRRLQEALDGFAEAEGIQAPMKELADLPLEDAGRLFTLAMSLEFEPTERQFLLESPDLPTLADRLLQLLAFASNGRTLGES